MSKIDKVVKDLDAKGSIWTKNLSYDDFSREDMEEFVTRFKNSFLEENEDEPFVGDFSESTFHIDEMYVDDYGKVTDLHVVGNLEGLTISLDIPLDLELTGFGEDVAEATGSSVSGLYFKHGDYKEVVNKKCDGAGRLTLGKEYAGKEVKAVVVDS